AGCAVMVEDALDPLTACVAIRTIGHDRGILQRDVDLVIEPVGHPAADLFAGGLAGVHRSMEGMMDVVIVALGTQRLFELGWGHRWQGHNGFLCVRPTGSGTAVALHGARGARLDIPGTTTRGSCHRRPPRCRARRGWRA